MDVTTAQLYDLLVEKGFEKNRVREALAGIATIKEVDSQLQGLEGRIDSRLNQLESRLFRAMLFQTGAIAAILLGMLQFAI